MRAKDGSGNLCTALLIDPERLFDRLDPVTEIEISTDSLASFYPLLSWKDADPIDAVEPARLPASGDTIWVDEDGLAKPIFAALYLRSAPQPYAGKAIITGSDEAGNIVPPRITADELREILSIDFGNALVSCHAGHWLKGASPKTREEHQALLDLRSTEDEPRP